MAALFKAEREADAVRTSQPSASAEHGSAAPMEVEDGVAAPSENKPAASQPGSQTALPQHMTTENAGLSTVEVRSLAVHSVLFESAVLFSLQGWPGQAGAAAMECDDQAVADEDQSSAREPSDDQPSSAPSSDDQPDQASSIVGRRVEVVWDVAAGESFSGEEPIRPTSPELFASSSACFFSMNVSSAYM